MENVNEIANSSLYFGRRQLTYDAWKWKWRLNKRQKSCCVFFRVKVTTSFAICNNNKIIWNKKLNMHFLTDSLQSKFSSLYIQSLHHCLAIRMWMMFQVPACNFHAWNAILRYSYKHDWITGYVLIHESTLTNKGNGIKFSSWIRVASLFIHDHSGR